MSQPSGKAAHVLSGRFPQLASDSVSRYVNHLKEQMGPSKASAVYSVACRVAPVADNPLGLQRGRIVQIQGDNYLALGCGFMNLEFARLDRPGTLRTLGADEFVRLGDEGFRVLDGEQSEQILEEVMAG
jgi:hypothetical protein